ncbi:MAG: SDR family NAD(P)-dependent oxidoreductase [Polyangiales bacterium]
MKPLAGRVAVVTGASRGVGRGIALALGDAGATVYVTGRSVTPGALPGTIGEVAAEVTARGGYGVAVRCDHASDEDVDHLFSLVTEREGSLDLLVNNAFAQPDAPFMGVPFWEQPLASWDAMHDVGLRSHYAASAHAARMMVRAKSGLIVNVSSFGASRYAVSVAYGVGKAGVDRLSRDCAKELKPHGVTVVSLWPGIVKTERLVAMGEGSPFDLTRAESALYTGRAVVALASDAAVIAKTGKALVVADLAREYGFTDEDGAQPEAPWPR